MIHVELERTKAEETTKQKEEKWPQAARRAPASTIVLSNDLRVTRKGEGRRITISIFAKLKGMRRAKGYERRLSKRKKEE